MTGAHTWHLTSLAFAVAMERVGRDRVPFPFTWTTDARTAETLLARRSEARRQADDAALLSALSLLSSDEQQITACGTGESDRPVRLRAAVAGEFGVVVAQDPGPSADRGGDVHVHAVSRSALVPTLVSVLPRVAAGRIASSTAARADLVGAPASYLHGSTGDDDIRRAMAVLDAPRAGLGEVVVGYASAVDGPLAARDGFRWIDVPGDGRYLLISGDQVSVRPADLHAITSALDDAMRRAVDGDPHGEALRAARVGQLDAVPVDGYGRSRGPVR